MRILSISGENIASLSAPFNIDFTAPPLLGAGLFAITGETGAGKSSILDAMCLALYGDAPRLAAGSSSDEVPDAGDAIKAKDTRTILRRGAVQGWAEVRFMAIDGQAYTAHWQARRARDKVDGKLQSVSRKLARASDGQILASQTNAVTEQIAALTGLSYDEFRRTVLLAQGDFDAFLRADTNDRAGLLEKVTGTGLYRAVSSKIYERTEAAKQVLDALTLRRDAHCLLSPEDRAAVEEERLTLIAAQNLAAAEHKAITAGLERHRRHAEAARQLALATEVEQVALDAVTAAAPDRTQLAMIDAAEPLRLPWQAVLDSTERVKDTKLAVTGTEKARNEASQEANRLAGLSDQASAAAKAKEDEFKAFGPIWDRAAELDSQIQTAKTEAENAAAQTLELSNAATVAQTVLKALQTDERAAQDAQTSANNTLTGLHPAFPLADRWDQTQRDLADHVEAQQAQMDAMTQATALQEMLDTLSKRIEALTLVAQTDHAAEDALTATSANLSDQIVAMEAKHPAVKSGALSNLSGALADMSRAARDHHAARADLGTATQTGTKAQADIAQSTTAITAAVDALTRAEVQITALTTPLAQADLALSSTAQNLRLHLEDGAPCPVCGSREHPVHADAALAKLAETMRGDIAAARHNAAEARTNQTRVQGLLAAAKARAAEAAATATNATLRIESALTAWTKARDLAVTIPLCPELPELPDTDGTALDRAIAEIAAHQQAEQTALSSLADLRKALGDISTRRETLRKAIAAHGVERDSLGQNLSQTQQQLALAQQEIKTQSTRRAKLEATLLPLLLAAGEAPGALGVDPQLVLRLEDLVGQITTARAMGKTATEALSSIAPKIATAGSRTEAAAAQAASAIATRTTRQDKYATLQSQRATLLGGEATAPHRTRFNNNRKNAQDMLTRAAKDHAEAAQLAAAALARHDAAVRGDTSAQAYRLSAENKLEETLVKAGVSAETVAVLFALPHETVERLRQSLRALDDTVTGARTTRAARATDMEALAQEALPDDSQDILTEALKTLDATITHRGQRIGAIQGDLDRDEATRKSIAGLEADIKNAKSEHEVWQAVNNAAGSRNGDKFARVAQSITLDVMVDHANHHLTDLNPRYRLRRAEGLALQIEDRDMGNEARATRSLSGGERFLVSLALALALSRMGGKGGLAATLFIDEGFGSLDPASLDVAIDALETLQSQGRQVGVISHVEAMKDRISTRIAVSKQGGGNSVVRVMGAGAIGVT